MPPATADHHFISRPNAEDSKHVPTKKSTIYDLQEIQETFFPDSEMDDVGREREKA